MPTMIEPPYRERARYIFSLVVDNDPKYQYQAYCCVRSLLTYAGVERSDIVVNFTPGNSASKKKYFSELGCKVREVLPFGDGKWCNKIAQLENLEDEFFNFAVLLDCDVFVLADFRGKLKLARVQAKPVDTPTPNLNILNELAKLAGINPLPEKIMADNGTGDTFIGNCNGGIYVIPRYLFRQVRYEWSKWTTWLFDNIGPLRAAGITMHADQVSFWLAIHRGSIPFQPLISNFNYFTHMAGDHVHFDSSQPIYALHYHEQCMNDQGLLEPRCAYTPAIGEAFNYANALISAEFRNDLFWDLRYAKYPERGSGIGSRGSNLVYKRQLLQALRIESASSVLDVGCGDLEVLKVFDLTNYLGLDQSEYALSLAKAARPDWQFRHFDPVHDEDKIPSRELVLCFELLIHQPAQRHYRKLIEFAASHADRVLIISGYESHHAHIDQNYLIYFHEPLSKSLTETGKFKKIEKIGEHTDVTIFRCEK
jgi:hypothetical protein